MAGAFSFEFEKPLGSAGDVAELEYISALHGTHVDSTIDALAIRHYLLSRFGMDVTEECVQEIILNGILGPPPASVMRKNDEILANKLLEEEEKKKTKKIKDEGKDEESDNMNEKTKQKKDNEIELDGRVLDIPTMASMLINPWLLGKITDDNSKTGEKEGMGAPMEVFYKVFLASSELTETTPITESTIQSLFRKFEELSLLDNSSVIQDTLDVVGPEATFSYQNFIKLLTHDIKLFPLSSLSSPTFFVQDVMQAAADASGDASLSERGSINTSSTKHFKMIKTAAAIDLSAENYVSSTHIALVWLAAVFAALCFSPYIFSSPAFECDDLDYTLCKILETVYSWSLLMVNIVVAGTPLIALTSIGNGGTADKLSEQIHGLFWGVVLVITPGFMLEFNYEGIADDLATDETLVRACVITYIVLGFLLVGYKLMGIWRIMILRRDDKSLRTFSTALQYFKHSTACDERYSKNAATVKIQAFMENAISLHYDDFGSESSQGDTHSSKSHSITENKVAIVKYEKNHDKGEPIGGMLWTWKLFFNKDLYKVHGIRLNARLLIGVAAVFIWLILVGLSTLNGYQTIADLYDSSDEDSRLSSSTSVATSSSEYEWSTECNGTFHADSCVTFGNPNSEGAVICSQVFVNYDSIQNRSFDSCSAVTYMSVDDLLTSQTDDIATEEEEAYTDATSWIEPAVNAFYSEYNSSFADSNVTYQEFTEELKVYGVFEPGLRHAAAFSTTAKCYGDIDYCLGTPDNLTISSSNQGDVWAGVCVFGISSEFQGSECDVLGSPFVTNTSDTSIDTSAVNEELELAEEEETLFELNHWVPLETANAIFAVSVGLVVIWLIYLVLSYLPSASTVILKYRYGLLPSLKQGKKFWKLRGKGQESSTYLLGAIFWGASYSSFLIFLLSILILVFTFSEVTRDIVIYLIAWTIGITLTIVFKMILVAMLAPRVFAKNHVYRDRPFSGNVVILALECWGFGVTAGYLLVRVCKLLGVALFYVGRIDQVMLADDLLGDMLDKYPINFRKDLLSHEAHRHPYIERLGVMYMMKLLLDDKGEFCNVCGTSWRVMLLRSVMPWLFKRRVHLKSEMEDLKEGDKKDIDEEDEDGEVKKTFLGRWKENLLKNNEL